MKDFTLDQVRAAKPKALAALARLAPLAGLGITRVGGGYGLKVNLRVASAVPFPEEFEGIPLRVEVVGSIGKRTGIVRDGGAAIAAGD